MQPEALQIVGTIFGSGAAAWAAVRIQIWWIIRTLDRHESYHNSHFEELKTIERRKTRNA